MRIALATVGTTGDVAPFVLLARRLVARGHEVTAISWPVHRAAFSEAGVRVDILRACASGWQGRATHRSQPGRSCVVFVGSLQGAEAPRTDGDHEMAGEEGIPLCDRMR